MPRNIPTAPQRRRLQVLRDAIRKAGFTIHTRNRRVNISAALDPATLPGSTRELLREIMGRGYQLQAYIPSADPRQDRDNPLFNSLIRQAA